jgi:hypothetical protein
LEGENKMGKLRRLVYTLWKRDRSLFLYKLLDMELGLFLWVLVAPLPRPPQTVISTLFLKMGQWLGRCGASHIAHRQNRQFLYIDQLFHIVFTFLLIFPQQNNEGYQFSYDLLFWKYDFSPIIIFL